MTDLTYFPQRRLGFTTLLSKEPLFAATGYIIAMSLVVTLGASFLDDRLFQGLNVWTKPIKFQIALTVYILTLAFFAQWLPDRMLTHPLYRTFSVLVVFSTIAELLWIGGASTFGIASHYNTDVPFMTAIYSLMGLFAVLITSASLVFGIAIWRNKDAELDPALRLSFALGLVLTFVLTIPVAGVLASQPGHFIGAPTTGALLPIMGWSREVGDLRVSHFFATHAMHFVPVAGLVIVAIARGSAARQLVWFSAIAFSALVGFTFFQAMAAKPFIPLV